MKTFKDLPREQAERFLYDFNMVYLSAKPETTLTWEDVLEKCVYTPAEMLELWPGEHRIAGIFFGIDLSYFRKDYINAIDYLMTKLGYSENKKREFLNSRKP